MNKILSIIVPMYNMEDYISRCLDSLILTEELFNLYEVIIVNDGSKDKSLEIARGYESLYPTVFRVIDKENGNYGSCINRGIEEANGIFTRTLDADDWFDCNGFVQLVKELSKLPDVDAVFTPYTIRYLNGESEDVKRLFVGAIFNTVVPLNINDFEKNHWPYGVHSLTVKTEILKKNVRLQHGISYTDMEFCLYSNPHIHSIIIYDINVYQYFVGREGQTVSFASYKKNYGNIVRILKRWMDHVDNGLIDITHGQEYVIRMIFSVYYKISLLYKERNSDDFSFFSSFDKWLKVKSDNLYNYAGSLKCRRLKYVQLWRLFKFDYTKILFNFFR